MFPRIQLRIDSRVVIDSESFVSEVEGSVLNFKLKDSDASPNVVDSELVAIGGWKLNVVSLIHFKARPEVVVNGWKSLGKLVPTGRLLIPFLYSTAIDYVRFSISGVEPKWTALLRLCYWHERCLELKDKKFHYKQTEMKRAILKPLRNTEKALNNKGKGFLPAMEQLHKAISSYTSELSLAVLANECNKVTFDKGHDFVFDAFPCEVKSVYSHMTIQREGDGTTRKFKIHGQTLGEKVNPYEEFFKFIFSRKVLKHIAKAYCQGARLVFLDASHTFASTLMYLLSTKREARLSFPDALNNATNLAKFREKLPVVVVSSISSYEHQTIALVVPMPSQLLQELSNKV